MIQVSYNKLWKLLIDKHMRKFDLLRESHIGSSTLTKMGHGRCVNVAVLGKICNALHCDIGDIVEFVDMVDDEDRVDEGRSKYKFFGRDIDEIETDHILNPHKSGPL